MNADHALETLLRPAIWRAFHGVPPWVAALIVCAIFVALAYRDRR